MRLYQGRFDSETLFDTDPVRASMRVSRNARWLHVVDLDGAREGARRNGEAIAGIIAAAGVPVQCGGGARSAADVQALLDLGVQRVVIGSMAAREPDTVARWLGMFGADRIVLALDARQDARGEFRLAASGWEAATETRLDDALRFFSAHGARHVLCTDISRDGTMQGPNAPLYAGIVSGYPGLELQASGGVRDRADLARLADAGVRHVIVGRAILEGELQCRQYA